MLNLAQEFCPFQVLSLPDRPASGSMFVCMCVYVCVSSCMHKFQHASVDACNCQHACMHGCMQLCMNACMYACMRACVRVGVYVYKLSIARADLSASQLCINFCVTPVHCTSSDAKLSNLSNAPRSATCPPEMVPPARLALVAFQVLFAMHFVCVCICCKM